jgi:Fur family transcriptional regulator, iron response regulator
LKKPPRNHTEHHHFYIEDRHELMDVSPTDMTVGKAPVPPDGYEIVHIDVVVRLRRKDSKQILIATWPPASR